MVNQVQDAYLVAAVRTPVGKARGVMRNVRPDDMLAHVIRAAMDRLPALDPKLIEDAIIGCAMPEAEQGMNVARLGVLLAGLPDSVPGLTINRFCSSGVQAVTMAADRIRLGEADVMIGGGTETMSMMPTMMGNKPCYNPAIFEKQESIGMAYGMGLTAERVAEKWQVSREDQDAFALTSHQKATAAIKAGKFQDEISPYTVRTHVPDSKSGAARIVEAIVEDDEGPRPDISPEALTKLRPVFASKGSVTAGNASQMSDGAGAAILVSEKILKEHNLTPLARFVSASVAGVPAEIMGIGPIEAVPRALKLAGLKQDDLDWIELNEAFAAQALACMRTLNLDPAKVNPQGGAIALGHPLGATGAIRVATLVSAMQRDPKIKRGMVSMCIGTGMGFAAIFERV
ncbi:MAG TPA: acetyl-CoA C-acyltransferase [Steroidobacteraceae bacterium]|nr:acetyl-CoA C-acyltransferase [Steroidobacteraceae bacterium]